MDTENTIFDKWLNPPEEFTLSPDLISFIVKPKSDFWQVTHYGFSRTDGNCLVKEIPHNTCFKVKVAMSYKAEFDQAGVIVYYDDENFAKMSVENQLSSKNKLGSVVTKNKSSDWATQNSENLNEIWYKISKRDNTYLFEYSINGLDYIQIRVFDIKSEKTPLIGVYGASPLGNGFQAEFTTFEFSENQWYLDLHDIPKEMQLI
jgi:regulation of enolase protein 1 (concanavalin A-like superfamily)